MKIKLILCLLISIMFYGQCANLSEGFRYSYQIKIPLENESRIYGFKPTDFFYQNSYNNYIDSRIIDVYDNLVPFIILPIKSFKAVKVQETCQSKIIKLTKLKNNTIELIINVTDPSRIPDTLSIITKIKDFDKEISVYGGDSLETINNKVSSGRIFDFSSITNISNRKINLSNDKRYKFLKVIVNNFSEVIEGSTYEFISEERLKSNFSKIKKIHKTNTILKIDNIILTSMQERILANRSKIITYRSEILSNKRNNGSTEIVIETSKQPISKINFNTDNKNYSRSILIEGSNDNKKFNYIKRTEVSKLSIPHYKEKNESIKFQEFRYKFYKITIYDKNLAPLSFKDISLQGIEYQVRFITDDFSGAPKFFFGNNKAKRVSFNISNVLKNIEQNKVGITKIINKEEHIVKSSNSIFSKKIILYFLIVLVFLLLGYAIYAIIKNVDVDTGKDV